MSRAIGSYQIVWLGRSWNACLFSYCVCILRLEITSKQTKFNLIESINEIDSNQMNYRTRVMCATYGFRTLVPHVEPHGVADTRLPVSSRSRALAAM